LRWITCSRLIVPDSIRMAISFCEVRFVNGFL
jgi:hypothetical protein